MVEWYKKCIVKFKKLNIAAVTPVSYFAQGNFAIMHFLQYKSNLRSKQVKHQKA